MGGFASISNRPSGDDVLLTPLFRRHGGRSAFCFDPGGYATTWRSESFIDLINQRKRWASNAAAQLKLNPVLFAYVASVLLVNTLPLVALIVGGKMVIACLVIWSLRLVADATVIGLATKRLNTSPNLTYFPTWLILQIPYVLVVGIGGSLLGFKWKGRTHRAQTSQPVPRILNDQPETDHVPM